METSITQNDPLAARNAEMLRLYVVDGLTNQMIADQFGVSKATVCKVTVGQKRGQMSKDPVQRSLFSRLDLKNNEKTAVELYKAAHGMANVNLRDIMPAVRRRGTNLASAWLTNVDPDKLTSLAASCVSDLRIEIDEEKCTTKISIKMIPMTQRLKSLMDAQDWLESKTAADEDEEEASKTAAPPNPFTDGV